VPWSLRLGLNTWVASKPSREDGSVVMRPAIRSFAFGGGLLAARHLSVLLHRFMWLLKKNERRSPSSQYPVHGDMVVFFDVKPKRVKLRKACRQPSDHVPTSFHKLGRSVDELQRFCQQVDRVVVREINMRGHFFLVVVSEVVATEHRHVPQLFEARHPVVF